jgi:hypothetical protein
LLHYVLDKLGKGRNLFPAMLSTQSRRLLTERFRSLFARPHTAPLFVFGNQKAGTSAIAGLLSAATGEALVRDFAGAREPNLGRLMRGETSVRDFVTKNAWAFSMPIVKEPGLTFVAPQLLEHFPESRAVFITRDPWANIKSILGRLNLRGDLDAPMRADGKSLNRTWQSIFAGRDLGFEPGHYIDIMAKRWARAAQICDGLGDRVVAIRYEDFNRSKFATIQNTLQKLELTARNDISGVLDHSFQRSGTPAGSMSDFFGPNLARIETVCGGQAARFGYKAPQAERLAAE